MHRTITVILATLALMAATVAAYGYNPPGGATLLQADPNQPNAHGIVALRGLQVLQGDGKANIAAWYQGHTQYLLNGTRQADTSGGEFSVAGQAVPKNSFTHFYSPSTSKGFVLKIDEYNAIVGAISFLSLAPWKYMTLKGPNPSMADMADWYYAQAVKAMREGSKATALEYLGYVLHYVSDATVPQHVTDEGAQKPGSQHCEYETACDTVTRQGGFPHAVSGGLYKPDSWTPGDYIKDAASYSKGLIANAKSPQMFGSVCNQMAPLAEKYCAGLLDRFYRLWQGENFRVVVVTIDRVKAMTYWTPGRSLDSPDQADLYAYVTIDGRQFETGVVDGCDDMSPNALIPYAWVFPKWIGGAKTKAEVKVAIWDDDGITGDDKAYICPKKNEKELWMDYDLATGAVSKDTSASPSSTSPTITTPVHTKGNHGMGDEAEIWLTVQRWP